MLNINSFEEDLLGLKLFADRLEKFLSVEHRYVDESLVVSLNAGFGEGKTTFLKMWGNHLKEKGISGNKIAIVEVNAWTDDYCGDPLVALISALIDSMQKTKKDAQSLKDAAKDVGWFLTGVGNQVVNKFVGIDPIAAGKIAESKKVTRKGYNNIPNSFFDIYKIKKKALESLKKSISNTITEDGPSILIFVDELDRCRPDYAISYLETIKHVFDIKGIVFVIAVDRHQLECTAKAAFGDGLNFSEYYRKFVQREINLPKPKEKNYKKLVSEYVNLFLQNENDRYCYMSIDYQRIDNIVELISSMKLSPRQIQEVFRIMGHVLQTDESKKGQLYWGLGVGTILMSVLRIGNYEVYEKIGSLSLGIEEAAHYFKSMSIDYADWWFFLWLSGGGLNSNNATDDEVTEILRGVGYISNDDEFRRDNLSYSFASAWGNFGRERFKQIYVNIEEITSWA